MGQKEPRYAIIETSPDPIVHVRVVGPLTEGSLAEHLDELEQTIQALPRFSLVLEQGRLRAYPIRFVRQSARWIRAALVRHKGRWVSTVYVITQPSLVAVVRGLFWAIEHPMPLHVTPSVEEAMAWSRERLREAGEAAGEPAL